MAESQYSISAILSVGEANASFVTWNSSTTLNSTAVLVNADYSYNTIVVTLSQTTTITGGVVTFQGSLDGANWFNMQGFSPGAFVGIGPTYTLQANTYATFGFNLTAIPYFQILLSTVISGSGAVTIGYAADSFVNAVASTQAGVWTVAVTQSTTPWVVQDVAAETSLASLASTVTNALSPAEPRLRVTGAGIAGQPDTEVVTIQGITNGTAVTVSGTAASGTSATGNPIIVAGVDDSGNVQYLPVAKTGFASPVSILYIGGNNNGLATPIGVSGQGAVSTVRGAAGTDAVSNSDIGFPWDSLNLQSAPLGVVPYVFNGTSWDRYRSAGVGNAVASTGLAVSAAYSEYLTTAPTPTSGQYSALQSDLAGNLKITPGQALQTLTAWTSTNFTLNATFALTPTNTSGEAVIVQLDQTGTLTTGAVTWQGTYDGANWVTIPAQQVLDPTTSTVTQIGNPYTFVTSTNRAFLILTQGYQQIRALASTALTGSGSVTANITQLPYAPGPTLPVGSLAAVAIPSQAVVVAFQGPTGNAVVPTLGAGGVFPVVDSGVAGDSTTNTMGFVAFGSGSTSDGLLAVSNFVYNGSTWDRQRTATVGNAVSATGLAASTGYSEYLTTAPTPTSGQYSALQSDLGGNLKVVPGLATQTLTAWSSVNFTLNATFALTPTNTGGCPAVIVQLDQTSGTFTTGAVTFQGTYDGSLFVNIPAQQVLDPTSATFAQIANPYTFVTSTNKVFLILMGGYQQIQALASIAITGTGAATAHVTQLSYVPEPPLKVNILGNAGATLDTAINTGAAPTNALFVENAPTSVLAGATSVGVVTVSGGLGKQTIKATSGNLYGFSIFLTATTTVTTQLFIQFWNTSNTTLANWIMSFPIWFGSAGLSTSVLTIPPGALAMANFSNGITVAVSTFISSTTTTTIGGASGTVFYL